MEDEPVQGEQVMNLPPEEDYIEEPQSLEKSEMPFIEGALLQIDALLPLEPAEAPPAEP